MGQTARELELKLRSSLKHGTLVKDITSTSHHGKKHTFMTTAAMIDRVADNRPGKAKIAATNFNKGENVDALLAEAIKGKQLRKIADWATDDKSPDVQPFHFDMGRNIGYGVRLWYDALEHFKTKEMAIVLQKDKDTALGFSVLTAYPSTKDFSKMEFTQLNLSEGLHNSYAYKYASPERRTYLDNAVEKGVHRKHNYTNIPLMRNVDMPSLRQNEAPAPEAGFA